MLSWLRRIKNYVLSVHLSPYEVAAKKIILIICVSLDLSQSSTVYPYIYIYMICPTPSVASGLFSCLLYLVSCPHHHISNCENLE